MSLIFKFEGLRSKDFLDALSLEAKYGTLTKVTWNIWYKKKIYEFLQSYGPMFQSDTCIWQGSKYHVGRCFENALGVCKCKYA